MAEKSRATRRQWRSTTVTATPRRSLVVTNWRRTGGSSGTAAGQRRLGRPARIGLGLVAAATCYLLAIGVVLCFNPLKPVGFYAVRAGYLTNLAVPPNASGLHGAGALAQLLAPRANQDWWHFWSVGRSTPQEIDLDARNWDRDLSKITERTVVVYLSGVAGADEKGPYLVQDLPRLLEEPSANSLPAPTTTPAAPSSRGKLYLQTVIARLSKNTNQRYLVLLDVVRPAALPALGMVRNDFDTKVQSLTSLVEAAGNLVVVAPGGPVEPAAPAPDGLSAFAQAVVAGLQGRPDQQGDRVDSVTLLHSLQERNVATIVLPPRAIDTVEPLPLTLVSAPANPPGRAVGTGTGAGGGAGATGPDREASPTAAATAKPTEPTTPVAPGSKASGGGQPGAAPTASNLASENPTKASGPTASTSGDTPSPSEVVDRDPSEADPAEPDGGTTQPPDAHWTALVARQATGPESYAPHLWRRYRELLSRDEALGRSLGPVRSSSRLLVLQARKQIRQELTELDRQEGRLDQARIIRLDHPASVSLALPLAGGTTPAPDEAILRQIRAITQAPADGVDPAFVAAHRALFHDLLLSRLEADPDQIVPARIGNFLSRLRDPERSRPAEAHLLAILMQSNHRPADLCETAEGRALVGLALQVRRLAGRAAVGAARQLDPGGYPHVEQIAPLVADLVAQGDFLRRPAEDLLFATDPKRRAQAQSDLIDARGWYEKAQSRATDLRAALMARDWAFADLPFYADWLLQSPERSETSLLLRTLEEGWRSAHRLASLLRPGADPIEVDGLSQSLQDLRRSFEADLLAEVNRLRDRTKSVSSAGAIVALLDTPFLTPDQRATLRERLADLARLRASADLARPAQATTPPGTEPAPTVANAPATPSAAPLGDSPDKPVAEPNLNQRAARVARLVLARLGPRGFDAPGEPASESFDRLCENLDQIEATTESSTRDAEALNRWGERLGRVQRHLPRATQTTTHHGRTESLQLWPTQLQAADLLGRTLIGAQSLTLAGEPAGQTEVEPTIAYRRRLVQWLLLAEAGRTLDDHWFSEGDDPNQATNRPAPPPYYQEVTRRLLADLDRVDAPLPVQDKDEAGGIVGRLGRESTASGRLNFIGPPRKLLVTDEPDLTPRYLVVPGQTGPLGGPSGEPRRWAGGRPVVWFDLPTAPSAPGPVAPSGSSASPAPDLGSASPPQIRRDVAIELDLAKTGPIRELGPEQGWAVADLKTTQIRPRSADAETRGQPTRESSVGTLQGVYRGQVIHLPTAFEIQPVPEVVVTTQAPPTLGSIAIEADPDLVARFGRVEGGALAIVLDCSGSMGAGPKALPGAPSRYREATAAVRQILARVARGTLVSVWVFGAAGVPVKTVTNSSDLIQPVRLPRAWTPDDPRELGDLMARLDALEPWNESPVIEAMIQARSALLASSGPRSLVVLTDGKDNRFEQPSGGGGAMAPKADITNALNTAFRGTGIDISIVDLGIGEDVRNQFAAIEQFRPRGRFVASGQVGQLADALRPTLRYWVRSLDNIPVRGITEGGDRLTTTPNFRRIEPGFYKVVVEAGNWVERPVAIRGGDRLIVRLEQPDGRLQLARSNWSYGVVPVAPPVDRDGWRLAILQNWLTPEGGLSMLVSLERRANPQEAALEQIRPDFVWMNVQASEAPEGRLQQRWSSVHDYPAPTWQVDIPHWPTTATGSPAEPILAATWSLQGSDRRLIIPVRDLPWGSGLDLERPVEVQTSAGPITIRGFALTPYPIPLPTEERLVVRLDHGAGQIVWARPIGLSTATTEDRYFTQVGRYTGTFGPLLPGSVRAQLKAIEIIAMDEPDARARRSGWSVAGLRAGPPSRINRAPERPVDADAALPAVAGTDLAPVPLPSAPR